MREAKPELLVGLNNLLSKTKTKTNPGRKKKTAAAEMGVLLNLTNNFYDLKNTDLTSPSPLSESNWDLDEVFSKVVNNVGNMLMEKLVFLVVELIIVVWKEAAVKLGGS